MSFSVGSEGFFLSLVPKKKSFFFFSLIHLTKSFQKTKENDVLELISLFQHSSSFPISSLLHISSCLPLTVNNAAISTLNKAEHGFLSNTN